MIFTHLARILSGVGLAYGSLRVVTGFLIAEEKLGPYAEALARYAPGAASSGQVIDRGAFTILAAVALGTLAEISLALRKSSNGRNAD